jgi:Protein of unknown function (DUF3313)
MNPIFISSRATKPNALVFTVVLATALSVSGCASVGSPERSSTLAGFDQLSVQPDGTRTWRNSAAGKVNTIRIDPKDVIFSNEVRIDEEQKNALRQALTESLTREFADAGVRVVSSPDATAASVRANITSAELASPGLNVVTAALLLMPLSRGSLSVEIEALGGNDNQRIAAMAFSGTAGVNNIGSAFSGLGHAKLQAEIAANKFAALVADKDAKQAR